jgi:hypothetical protein
MQKGSFAVTSRQLRMREAVISVHELQMPIVAGEAKVQFPEGQE